MSCGCLQISCNAPQKFWIVVKPALSQIAAVAQNPPNKFCILHMVCMPTAPTTRFSSSANLAYPALCRQYGVSLGIGYTSTLPKRLCRVFVRMCFRPPFTAFITHTSPRVSSSNNSNNLFCPVSFVLSNRYSRSSMGVARICRNCCLCFCPVRLIRLSVCS